MKGYATTFLGLFDGSSDDAPLIREIEIPIIQRDFAQGRSDDEATTIRERFLDSIVRAIRSTESLGLDFVYGDVKSGVLRPLDGQQRLTTLFLLHWYVASLAGTLAPGSAWLRFSYATRPTARDFTEALGEHPYPGGEFAPSEWITDQPWYVYPWRQDPTIASMLVMLDAIHSRLDPKGTDFGQIWSRLAENSAEHSRGAIWFLFLPVVDADSGEDLYIKMNSRGKALTTFEVFKADFESIIKAADPSRHRHLVDSIDGPWADTLWQYEKRAGSDYKVDEEFERYLTFIIEISEWRDGRPDRKWHDKSKQRLWPIEERARLAFADPENEHSDRNCDFFFHCFDTWVDREPAAEFSQLFAAAGRGGGPLPLFSTTPDLYEACISRYGEDFTVQETLLLFGVLLARQAGDSIPAEELTKRLRSLRNVTAAFLDRERYMSSYVASTEKLIVQGALDGLDGFRGDWVADEAVKNQFLEEHPEVTEAVHVLEDNPLVRGRIMAFDLDEACLEKRAIAFSAISASELRDRLGAALLTKGDYSREIGWHGDRRQLGSSQKDDSWTDMLTTGSRADLAGMRQPLAELLDDFAERSEFGGSEPEACLTAIVADWLARRELAGLYDWRYYLARYAGARSSKGDGYYHGRYDAEGGFNYGRLRILHGSSYNAYFSDALLRAAWFEGDLGDVAKEPSWWHRDDPGLTLKGSHAQIRCADRSFEISLGTDDDATRTAVEHALASFGVDDNLHVVQVQQKLVDGRLVDCEDRIQLCIRLVRAMADSGL